MTTDVLLSILLDRSGSMTHLQGSTIEGFNAFVSDQRQTLPAKTKMLMQLVQFDDRYEVNFTPTPVDLVPPLGTDSYIPRGATALNDALVHAINDTRGWVKRKKWKGRVLFMVVTDGQENASHESTTGDVAQLVKEMEDEHEWSFVYMGANVDTFAESSAMGMSGHAAYLASPVGTQRAWNVNSAATSAYTTSGASGQSASADFYAGDTAAPAAPAASGTLKVKAVGEDDE